MSVMFDTSCSKQRGGSLDHKEINVFVQKWFFPIFKFSWKTATSLRMLSSSQTPQVLQFKSKKEHSEEPRRDVNKVGIEIAMDIESKMSLRAIFTQSVCTHMHMSEVFLVCELLLQKWAHA